MGCFSFMCQGCGKAVLSDSFSGHQVELFLLKDGDVIQHMSGQYDSYGRVFTDDTCEDSVQWEDPDPDAPLEAGIDIVDFRTGEVTKPGVPYKRDIWHKVCDLMYDSDISNGIAAIHTKCYHGVLPTVRSEDDPNQGWGDDLELLGSCGGEVDYDEY